MQARVLERLRLESGLCSALGRDELKLNYQPKIDLKTGEITGVEALLRWHHPDRGLVPPSQFIPVAEESGLADAGAATTVTAMINIGKSLHHRVIAEGVETRAQVLFLQKQGCGEDQGSFFCHPVIAEKFAQFLESGLREYVVH